MKFRYDYDTEPLNILSYIMVGICFMISCYGVLW